jgi:hypothetical protein
MAAAMRYWRYCSTQKYWLGNSQFIWDTALPLL